MFLSRRGIFRYRWPAATGLAVAFVAGLLLGAAWRTPKVRPGLVPPAVSAPVAEPARDASRTGYPAEVLRVIDGDTFEARVHVWLGLDVTTKVRLRGIDAPELRARCPDELQKAEAARGALMALLAEGDIQVSNVGRDKYGGRVVADAATRRTPNISQAMLAAGHARRYGGGRRESWCAELRG